MTDFLSNRAFFHGFCDWKEQDGGVFLTHLPEKTHDWYKEESERWSMRAHCYAGIRLEAETNATKLTFSLQYLDGDTPLASFGLVIDGEVQPVVSLVPEELNNPVEIALDGQPHKVTVYFPHLISFTIKSAVADGDATPVAPMEKRYYAFGDSITQGITGENPANTYPAQVARAFHLEHWNFGVGGIHFNEGTLTGMEEMPKADVVTIALGTNDWSAGKTENMSTFLKKCAAYLKKIDELFHDSKIFVLLPTWRADEIQSMKRGNLQNIRENIARTAAFFPNMKVIDCQDMIPHDTKLFADGFLHPNEEGFLHYGTNLIAQLQKEM